MQLATSGYSTQRSPAGLGVTIAVHAGLVALAVIGLRTVAPPKPVPPIVTKNIPNPSTPVVKQADPVIVDHQFKIDVVKPILDYDDTPATEKAVQQPSGGDAGPAGGTATGGDATVEPIKPPAGITRSASIDPRYRADFEAPYPAASRRMGEEGTVLVRVVVGIDGRVVRAVVARSSGFERLDTAALKQALAKWRFVPALSDGRAVEAEREIPVTFRLAG